LATFIDFYNSLDNDVALRGKQFERFCKWYLENDPYWKNEVEIVWLWEDYPDRWANKDLGVDLVFRDKDKNIWAVQAKCYDPDYYIKYEDMATFIAESNRPQIHKRLLIASTDNLGKNAISVLVGQDNKPVIRVMLSDFVKSNLIFPDHPNELKKAKLLPKPEPVGKYDYQLEPINAVAEAFKTHDRGQLIMACGTGKTFTTLWIKEKLNSESTLILLPSLSLLSQTLTEWNFAMNQDFRSLAVCSDESVTKGAKDDDRTLESVSELPFPVTSDPAAIASFLKSQGHKVVFSTYQSSQMIAEAMGDSTVPLFDLVIADEAHRCTGNMDSAFATVLDDSKIRTKKKLFTTATPRTYSTNIKQAAEERDIKITGMDDESVFGPVFFRLSFGDAIKRGLLTDYQLVIIGVDDGMIAEYINKRELISTDKEKVTDAKSLAAMIGLLKAIKDYDLKRLITFHSRVSKARDFSEEIHDIFKLIPDKDLPEGVIATDYVSGQMPTGQRRQKLQQLKELTQGDRMILSNARCLSEGVDVPALDAVAIIDPRQSTVDIVQTVGRAIRLSKDKKVGTIVMPVFLEPGEDAEGVIENSNFKPIWDVVNALKAHDDSLSFELDAYRTGLGKDKKTASHVTGLDKIVIDLPKQYDASFTESLRTILVEVTTENWLYWYGILQKYKDEFGDCSPSTEFLNDDGLALGRWVTKQRTIYNNQKISKDRVKLLDAIGFDWDPIASYWNEGFNQLQKYKAEFGDCSPSRSFKSPNEFTLGSWVTVLRASYKKGILPDDKVKLLEGIGFDWDPLDSAWNYGFKQLQKYKDEFGDFPPNGFVCADGFALGRWITKQRTNYNAQKLSEFRIQLLEGIGFIWDLLDSSWNEGFRQLQKYKDEFGNSSAPNGFVCPDGFSLGNWIGNQRASHKRGELSLKRIAKLDEIGFIWDPLDSSWNEGFRQLQKYKDEFGNSSPSKDFSSIDGFSLGNWVSSQRVRYKNGKLEELRIKKLEEIGFIWDRSELAWNEGLMQLQQYKNAFGNCSPPQSFVSADGYPLGVWASARRKTYKQGKLSQERIKLLENLGFVWQLI
jgi:superfamily II DNA or RNA helicase